MSTKPLINQVSEGIQFALGMDTQTKGEFIPKLKKAPRVKIPLTKEQKRKAYLKRRNKAAFNRRFRNVELGQKRTNNLNKQLQKGIKVVNQKTREHSALKRQLRTNKKAIDLLRKQLRDQKKMVMRMMKRWEQKNKMQLRKMDVSFRKKLRSSQEQAFKKYARQIAKKKTSSSLAHNRRKADPKRRILKHRNSLRKKEGYQFPWQKILYGEEKINT